MGKVIYYQDIAEKFSKMKHLSDEKIKYLIKLAEWDIVDMVRCEQKAEDIINKSTH